MNIIKFVLCIRMLQSPQMLFSLDLFKCELQITAFFFTGGNGANQVGGSRDSNRIQRFAWCLRMTIKLVYHPLQCCFNIDINSLSLWE